MTEYTEDPRAHVLYLRSFNADDTRLARPVGSFVSPFSWFSFLTSMSSHEQEITDPLWVIGPLVALARPGGEAGGASAERIPAEDDEWTDRIMTLMDESALVLLRIGHTKSLFWELEQCVARLDPRRFVLWLQIGHQDDPALRQARYDRWRKKAQSVFAHELPTQIGANEFIYFDHQWRPHLTNELLAALGSQGFQFEHPTRYLVRNSLPFAPVEDAKTVLSINRKRQIAAILSILLGASAAGFFYGTVNQFLSLFVLSPVFLFGVLLTSSGLVTWYARKTNVIVGDSFLPVAGFGALLFLYCNWIAWASYQSGVLVVSPVDIWAVMGDYLNFVRETFKSNRRPIHVGLATLWCMEAFCILYLFTVFVWSYAPARVKSDLRSADLR